MRGKSIDLPSTSLILHCCIEQDCGTEKILCHQAPGVRGFSRRPCRERRSHVRQFSQRHSCLKMQTDLTGCTVFSASRGFEASGGMSLGLSSVEMFAPTSSCSCRSTYGWQLHLPTHLTSAIYTVGPIWLIQDFSSSLHSCVFSRRHSVSLAQDSSAKSRILVKFNVQLPSCRPS